MQLVCKSWARGYNDSIVAIHAALAVPRWEAMHQFSGFQRLGSLHLAGDLHGASLLQLRESGVKNLDLSGSQGVSPGLLDSLRGAPLTKLSLYGCPEVGDECMQALGGLPISELNIGATSVGHVGLAALRGLPHLSTLLFRLFDGDLVGGRGVYAISNLNIASLELAAKESGDDNVEAADLDCIRGLKGLPLTQLNIEGHLSDYGLGGLKGMPLTSLKLKVFGGVSDVGIGCLRGMPLQTLCLDIRLDAFDDDPEFGEAWGVISGLPLTCLHLRGPYFILPDSMHALPCSLTSLHLSIYNHFHDASLSALKGMSILADLRLDHCSNITDRGMSFLQGLPLAHLELTNCTAAAYNAL